MSPPQQNRTHIPPDIANLSKCKCLYQIFFRMYYKNQNVYPFSDSSNLIETVTTLCNAHYFIAHQRGLMFMFKYLRNEHPALGTVPITPIVQSSGGTVAYSQTAQYITVVTIRNSSAVFAMHNMPRMYHDVLICGRSPHFSAENEIYFITKVPTPKNILSDNTNLLILYTKYIIKILARRKYKELSKRKNFV